jgi:ankyrin repeat protein
VLNEEPYGPLWVAVSNAQTYMAHLLIENGADPREYERRARRGMLSLALDAVGCGGGGNGPDGPPEDADDAETLFQVLLDHGADANCRYDTRCRQQAQVSLLHFMALSDDVLPLTRVLLDPERPGGRCDLEARDGGGATPLFWACRAPETAKLLVERGADIWARNTWGELAWEAEYCAGYHASNEDRARLKQAVQPPAEEPEESRRRHLQGSSGAGGAKSGDDAMEEEDAI